MAASVTLHGGVLFAYKLLEPPPPLQVTVARQGPGRGTIVATPSQRTCRRDVCTLSFAPGTEVELRAEPGEESTFLGWSGECTPRPEEILRCTLTLERDAEVAVEFGRMPKEVEVAWVNLDDEPPDEERLTVRLPDPEIEAEMLVEPLAELLPELAEELPPPEEEVPPPPEEAPPQQLPEMANMRSVELPDQDEVEETPDDATHLSDKNRDVAEETRAEDTNLEREMAGSERFSEESEVVSDEIGAEEDEIADLEDVEETTLDDVEPEDSPRTGDSERAVGAVAGEAGEGGDEGEAGDGTEAIEPGVLAMRGIEGRGPIAAEDHEAGRGGDVGRRGREGAPGVKTDLAFEDYERIVGRDKVEEEVALGRKRMSRKRGRWERKMEVMRSALENFTPEVRTGNQTALKTRAAPFAVYIARMHRSIHELWGFGFLEDINDKPANHPMNNWDLHTELEIVINGDGTVHKVNILRHSGLLEFDVAALDTIMTAGPYDPPPKKILSPDGRAYMHWGFYRNHRQCGTFNAQPFILGDVPAESPGREGDGSELLAQVSLEERMRALDRAAARAPKGARSGPITADDPEAVHAANLWITGFKTGNVARMLQVSTTPFRAGGNLTVGSSTQVRSVYRTVLRETRSRMNDWRLVTPAGYRKRFGSLPSGVEPGGTPLLVVVQSGSQRFALSLARQEGGAYKVDGIFR